MSTVGAPSSTQRPRNRGICMYWRSGRCAYGEKCRFKHEEAGNSGAGTLTISKVGESELPVIGSELIENAPTSVVHTARNGTPRRESVLPSNSARYHRAPSRRNPNSDQPSFMIQANNADSEQTDRDTAPPVADIAETPDQSASDTINLPHYSMARVCRYWNGSGGCARGNNCSYKHVSGSSDIKKVDLPLLERKAQGRKGKQRRDGQLNRGAIRQAPREAQRSEEGDYREELNCLADESRQAEQMHIEEERRGEEERRKEEQGRLEKERRREEERLREERQQEERRREQERRREEERRRGEERRKERERVAREEKEAKWTEEAAVVQQYVVFDSSLVTCAAGLDIRNIVTGFDLCCVRIKNLPRDAKVEEIADIFLQQGISSADFFVSGIRGIGNISESVVLAKAEYGQALAIGLEGIEFRDKALSFEISDNVAADAMGATVQSPFLTVSWRVPTNAIVATYTSRDVAQKRVRELNGQTWKDHRIKAAMNDYVRRGLQVAAMNSVKISNIPQNAITDPDFIGFIGTHTVRPLTRTPYDHDHSHLTVRNHLIQRRGVQLQTYETLSTNDKDEARVKVQFDDWEDVKLAHESIHNKRLGSGMLTPNLRAWHPRPLQYSIKIPSRQYSAQRKLWDGLSEKKAGKEAFVQTREGDRGDIVFVRVLGDNKKATGALKVRVESLVSGEALGVDYWHPSFVFSRTSKTFFDRAFEETGAFVRTDFKTRTLKVYGEAEKVDNARRLIEEEVKRLQGLETTRVIDRGSIAFFVREGVGRLKELIGEENVTLHLVGRVCRITIKGGQEAIHHLHRLIEEAPSASSTSQTATGEEEDICPVCYTNASNPEQLGCGHTYCAGCLRHFLSSAAESKSFPLVCVGNDATCNTPISIPFIRRFMPEQAFKHLTEVAFTCYLERNPQVYKYCPTADCKQVYRRQTEKKALQCPSCFSSICPACDEEAHPGLTCEEGRFQRDPAAQERLNEQFGFRKCPQCRGWIEKNGGCNHMACQCGAHICWKCMGVFPSSEIYTHMNSAHDGIYDDELPAGVNARIPARNFVVQQADALAQIERQRADAERRRVEVARLQQLLQTERQRVDAERRRAEEARQQQLLQQTERQRADAERRRAEEARQQQLFQQIRRQEEERLRQGQAEEAEATRRRRYTRILEFQREVRLDRERRRQQETESGGLWSRCIVM